MPSTYMYTSFESEILLPLRGTERESRSINIPEMNINFPRLSVRPNRTTQSYTPHTIQILKTDSRETGANVSAHEMAALDGGQEIHRGNNAEKNEVNDKLPTNSDDVAMAMVGCQENIVDQELIDRALRKIDFFLIPAMIVGCEYKDSQFHSMTCS